MLPTVAMAQVTFVPSGEGAPRDTTSGGTREGGLCGDNLSSSDQGLVAVMPHTNYGRTISERPTFMAYVPPTEAQVMFFSIEAEDESDYYYQTTFVLDAPDGGIVRLPLPEDAPELEVDQNYRWSMVVICGAMLRPDDPGIEDWVRRVAPSPTLAAQLPTTTGMDQAVLYGAEGIWFDMVGTVVTLRQSNPEDLEIANTWQAVLVDRGLDAIATMPILDVLN